MGNNIDKRIIKNFNLRFGQIALDKGFVNTEQLNKALNEQIINDVIYDKLKTHKVVGEIFFENGWMTPKQIKIVLAQIFINKKLNKNSDICSYCGQIILKGAFRCIKCGKLLKTAHERVDSLQKFKEPEKRKLNIGSLIKSVIFLLAIGTAFLYLTNHNNPVEGNINSVLDEYETMKNLDPQKDEIIYAKDIYRSSFDTDDKNVVQIEPDMRIDNTNKLNGKLKADDQYTLRTIYTIQTGSLTKKVDAQKQFKFIIQDLNEKELDFLRIEKVGKYYTVRLGKFEDYATTEKFLQTIKPQFPTSIILKAYIKDDRIVKLYE